MDRSALFPPKVYELVRLVVLWVWEKRGEKKLVYMVIPEKAAPVTGTILRTTGRVPADYHQ